MRVVDLIEDPEDEVERALDLACKLGLAHAAERLAEHVAEAAKEMMPPHRLLDRLLQEVLVYRDDRRVKTSV